MTLVSWLSDWGGEMEVVRRGTKMKARRVVGQVGGRNGVERARAAADGALAKAGCQGFALARSEHPLRPKRPRRI